MIAATEDIQSFIDFHHDDEPLSMPGVGEVLLSVGTAEAMGIDLGDTILLRDPDMRTLEVTVSRIYDNMCTTMPLSCRKPWSSSGEKPRSSRWPW